MFKGLQPIKELVPPFMNVPIDGEYDFISTNEKLPEILSELEEADRNYGTVSLILPALDTVPVFLNRLQMVDADCATMRFLRSNTFLRQKLNKCMIKHRREESKKLYLVSPTPNYLYFSNMKCTQPKCTLDIVLLCNLPNTTSESLLSTFNALTAVSWEWGHYQTAIICTDLLPEKERKIISDAFRNRSMGDCETVYTLD